MMKRKKKKKVSNQHSKQEQRANYNHFCRQILHYLKVIDCEELAELFDKESLSLMYAVRNSGIPKIRMAPGISIGSSAKKRLLADFDRCMSAKNIEINEHLSLSAKEIFQYLDLINANMDYKGEKCLDAHTGRLIQQYKDKVPDFKSTFKEAIDEMSHSATKIGLMSTKMNANIYWIKHLKNPEGDEDRKRVLEVNEFIPRKKTMFIDGHARPVYPVSLAFNSAGPLEISIPKWRVRISKDSNKEHLQSEIPVYFQNHLLYRLEERLDCIPPEVRQFWLFSSLESPTFNYFQGKRLVEYHVGDNTKLGYIVLELHKGRFLAKTFLLLTNSGTPEGEKLKELSGMQKCDLQYWAIDKLSTFQTSDLKDHLKTKTLFYDSGCGNLFENLSTPESIKGTNSFTQAKQMVRYMEGIKETEEMLMAV